MRKLLSSLRNNPTVVSKYIRLGFFLMGKATATMDKFMRHFLVVNGIDPNTRPGERTQRELAQAFSDVKDPDDYVDDFDFSWAQKSFARTRDKMGNLNLSKERYLQLTDLSNLPVPKRTGDYRELLNRTTLADQDDGSIDVEFDSPNLEVENNVSYVNPSGVLNSATIKEALHTLRKYAQELENEPEVDCNSGTVVAEPRGIKTVKNFLGCFRRVTNK